jgi:hypothetical protein
MPKKRVEKVHLTVTVDVDLNEWLEKTAAEFRLNKSQLINNLISMGKDDVELMGGIGLLGAAKKLRELKETLLKKKRTGVAVEASE